MSNYKIRVNSEVENKEVQGIFKILGGAWSEHVKADHYDKEFLYLTNGVIEYDDLLSEFLAVDECKEITLPELRDLVVLKRNYVGDATHYTEKCGAKGFLTSDGIEYFWDYALKEWSKHKQSNFMEYQMKPMKEYLIKSGDGKYLLTHHDSIGAIEIPEGATKLVSHGYMPSPIMFVKPCANGYSYCYLSGIWSDTILSDIKGRDIFWSRHTHPEELPFIDDEPLQSLNDQYAEIEKVRQSHRTASETADPTIKETLNQRQSQYGSFEDVAMFTEQMVDVMRKGYYENLAYNQKMALYMICSKMARIVNGNPNHKDSWHDIAGYATLIDNELVSEKDMPF